MNILLWVLQILLVLYNLIGGIYMINNFEMLANAWALNALPRPAWMVIGLLQIVFALGLLWPKLTPSAAIGLAVISLLGMALYVAYAGFPGIVWAVVPAMLAAFVAYGRMR
jgi:hypothetical protein